MQVAFDRFASCSKPMLAYRGKVIIPRALYRLGNGLFVVRCHLKTIGLIGGMSWESSAVYYRLINQETKRQLGGHHNAKSVMVTLDFAEVETLQHQGSWEPLESMLSTAAKQAASGGADCIVLCTNTMHKLAAAVEGSVTIPFLHIADATAAKMEAVGVSRVGLLGTKFTMEHDFYRGRLAKRFGAEVLVPEEEERREIHHIIYEELCHGIIEADSRKKYIQAMEKMKQRGAEGIILGCTEITLLVKQRDCSLPLFDTTAIHAESAVSWALQ